MSILLLQQAGEADGGFDAGIVWRTLATLGESVLARVLYILVAPLVFGGILTAARVVRSVTSATGAPP